MLVFVISVISFLIMRLAPGGALFGQLDPKMSPAARESFIRKHHLDRPLHVQYWLMMRDLFRGELRSTKDDRAVIQKISERLPATIRLNVFSLLISFGFGIPWGVYAARHANTWKDRLGGLVAFILIAMPTFWLAYLLCMFFVGVLGMPVLGISTFGVVYENRLLQLLDSLWHLLLPGTLLALGSTAIISRFVRASTLETLGEDYIRTARAKGLDPLVVYYKHALRNSLRPVITMIGGLLPALIGGAVIMETIFAYPGIGRLGYEAVLERDYPLMVALNFITAILVLLGNLLADVLYAVVDPRIRYS
jgi:peptide/nickel transport system permease protein